MKNYLFSPNHLWIEYSLIGLLSLLTRFYRIGWHPLWLDELYSYQVSTQDFLTIMQNSFFESHPPLYYLLLKLAIVSGHSELAVRWFSALCASIMLCLFYILAKQISNRLCAFTIWIILLVSPAVMYFSQEARSYIFAMTIATGSIWLIHYLSQQPAKVVRACVAWVILSMIGIYVAYCYIAVVAIQGLYLLILYRFRRKVFFCYVCIALAFMPLIPLLLSNLESDLVRTTGSGSLTVDLVLKALLAGDPARYGVFWGTTLLPLLLSIIAVLGSAYILVYRERFGIYVIAQIMIPLLLFFGIGNFYFDWNMPVFQSRQFLVLLPSFFILVTYGLQFCVRNFVPRKANPIIVVMGSVIILASLMGLNNYWTMTKSPEGLAVKFVHQSLTTDEAVVLLHYSLDAAASFYLTGTEKIFAKPQQFENRYMFDTNLLILRGQAKSIARFLKWIFVHIPVFGFYMIRGKHRLH